MKVIITFTFCCDHLWKSKFMALEMPGKLGEFFSPILWPPCRVMLKGHGLANGKHRETDQLNRAQNMPVSNV